MLKYLIVLAVAAFIYDPKKGLLIIKKSPREKIDGGLWTVPGGKVEIREPIIEALKREVKEEVGLEITEYEWIGEDVFESNEYVYHAQHFLCQVKSESEIVLEDKMEDYKWIKFADIEKYNFPVNIKKALVKIFKNLPT